MPYGEEFHKTRKLFAEALSQSGVRVFQDNQLNQAHLLLKNFLASPDQFSSHVRRCGANQFPLLVSLTCPHRFASAVILEIAYGHRVETDDDPYLQLTEDINQCVAGAGEPGMAAIDFIPLCVYDSCSGSVFPLTWECSEISPRRFPRSKCG